MLHIRPDLPAAPDPFPAKCIGVKKKEGTFTIPEFCPVCHARTEIRISEHSGTKTLHCTNPDCTAKHVKKFSRFVSKPGMDIDGLSIQTMLKFMNLGYIHYFEDIYTLKNHADEIRSLDGFGEKSCNNMLQAIEKSKNVDPVHFIYALCIPQIGTDAGKKMIAALGTGGFFQKLHAGEGFEDIDGIGPERSTSMLDWYRQNQNRHTVAALEEILNIAEVEPKVTEGGTCEGLTFVITGDVHQFKNRTEFKEYVESQNGSVTGSVSKKTDYLVNNDIESTSSKNQKAKSLGIPIISEDMFVERFGK